ncbi:MAG: Carboxyl-terminal protease [Parcubacteria group bacterium GW2011_GWC1_45_14]|nr:MAG: Carboxyl-terminal protease [Parcubacteria group bacterium GW2011_GWC1_45_14]
MIFDRYRTIVSVMLLLIIAFWVGFDKGKKSSSEQAAEIIPLDKAVVQNEKGAQAIDFSLYWDVWELLKEKYVESESLDAKKLLYGSIDGMLRSTGDPYTSFLSPDENKRFNEEIEGSFEGIGAELGIKNGILTIIAPLEGTPAEKAGLRAGDKIIDINGKSAQEMTLEAAVDQIRGPKNTEVVLTIFREGEETTRDISVQRNVIDVKSVKLESKDGDIAYIKISRFGDDTTREFSTAINRAVNQNAKGIVLDLRNNPGGYLEGAVDVSSKMLPKGKIVVIEENGDKSRENIYARGGDVASGIETIIMINEGSASASEILAGALKENRENVTIVGKKSFGKGSVQELIRLPQGTAAKITVARWLTPDGNQINEQGISPEVEVELTNEDYESDRDPQLDRALDIVREKTAQ